MQFTHYSFSFKSLKSYFDDHYDVVDVWAGASHWPSSSLSLKSFLSFCEATLSLAIINVFWKSKELQKTQKYASQFFMQEN